MSPTPFPERVIPRKMCQGNGTVNSTIPLAKFLRLSEYLHDLHGRAEVSLGFDRDAAGNCILRGTVKAELNMLCQRCLDPVPVTVKSEVLLRIAEDEAGERAIAESLTDPGEKMEIVVCREGYLDLLSLVEDELIMSLPIVAAHDNEHCNDKLNTLQQQAGSIKAEQGAIKGMESLEKLRQDLKRENEQNRKN